jgi:predicted TIM-barrel enzyme
MDVVTTSGVATGQEADLGKIATFRQAIGDKALAIASGITPDNAASYGDVDCFMVATGINAPGNFYDIDPARLHALMQVTRTLGQRETS